MILTNKLWNLAQCFWCVQYVRLQKYRDSDWVTLFPIVREFGPVLVFCSVLVLVLRAKYTFPWIWARFFSTRGVVCVLSVYGRVEKTTSIDSNVSATIFEINCWNWLHGHQTEGIANAFGWIDWNSMLLPSNRALIWRPFLNAHNKRNFNDVTLSVRFIWFAQVVWFTAIGCDIFRFIAFASVDFKFNSILSIVHLASVRLFAVPSLSVPVISSLFVRVLHLCVMCFGDIVCESFPQLFLQLKNSVRVCCAIHCKFVSFSLFFSCVVVLV